MEQHSNSASRWVIGTVLVVAMAGTVVWLQRHPKTEVTDETQTQLVITDEQGDTTAWGMTRNGHPIGVWHFRTPIGTYNGAFESGSFIDRWNYRMNNDDLFIDWSLVNDTADHLRLSVPRSYGLDTSNKNPSLLFRTRDEKAVDLIEFQLLPADVGVDHLVSLMNRRSPCVAKHSSDRQVWCTSIRLSDGLTRKEYHIQDPIVPEQEVYLYELEEYHRLSYGVLIGFDHTKPPYRDFIRMGVLESLLVDGKCAWSPIANLDSTGPCN